MIINSTPTFARIDAHECSRYTSQGEYSWTMTPKSLFPALISFYSGTQGWDGAKETNIKKRRWDNTAAHYYGANINNNFNETIIKVYAYKKISGSEKEGLFSYPDEFLRFNTVKNQYEVLTYEFRDHLIPSDPKYIKKIIDEQGKISIGSHLKKNFKYEGWKIINNSDIYDKKSILEIVNTPTVLTPIKDGEMHLSPPKLIIKIAINAKKSVGSRFFNRMKTNFSLTQENYQYYYDENKKEVIYVRDFDADKYKNEEAGAFSTKEFDYSTPGKTDCTFEGSAANAKSIHEIRQKYKVNKYNPYRDLVP